MAIDISREDDVLVDGRSISLVLIRAIIPPGLVSRVRIEHDDASVEDFEIRRDGAATHFTRSPRSAKGTDAKPVEMEHRAELVSPTDPNIREWVDRGSQREAQLVTLGWTEQGKTRTRPRAVSAQPDAVPSPTTPPKQGRG